MFNVDCFEIRNKLTILLKNIRENYGLEELERDISRTKNMKRLGT